MKFRYLRDPLFLAAVTLYALHRWAIRPFLDVGLLRQHLNDLLCIAFWVPAMVWGLRRLGVRDHDGIPTASEILVPLLMWSVVFEVFLPSFASFKGLAFADPRDVLSYTLGALLAWCGWVTCYRSPVEPVATQTLK